MTSSKLLAVAGLAAALSAAPYTITGIGAGLITEQTACASAAGGFCTDAGCSGGSSDCYRPPSGGMCYTTIRTPPPSEP